MLHFQDRGLSLWRKLFFSDKGTILGKKYRERKKNRKEGRKEEKKERRKGKRGREEKRKGSFFSYSHGEFSHLFTISVKLKKKSTFLFF